MHVIYALDLGFSILHLEILWSKIAFRNPKRGGMRVLVNQSLTGHKWLLIKIMGFCDFFGKWDFV